MGGAAGHMAHPFDCREVRNGRDLINFYVKAVNSIPLYEEESRGSSVSLKLDGVNTSFRLQKANNPAGFMFVMDRGAKKRGPITGLDFDGITPDNVVKRFKGNEEHGMVQVVNHMSKILNHDLMKLRPYVEALGIFERMGPEGVFFDAEYYANEDKERGYQPVKNAVDYNQNYIAIHRLSEFYNETKETKTGKINTRRLTRGFYWETVAEINDLLKKKDELMAQRQDTADIDQLIAEKNNELKAKKQEHQEVLDDLAKAIQEHVTELKMPFNVYTKIGVRFKEGLTREMVLKNIDKALDMRVPYNYKKVNEKMSVGPVSINEQTGELEGRTLKELLLSVKENPAHVAYYPNTPGFTKDGESVKGRIQTKGDYKKDPKQSAFALDIYKDVMITGHETGIGPFDIGNTERDADAINSAVIFWHAVRYIGRAIKESIVTDVDLGPAGENHEGIVIQSTDICDGIAFKFTGNFIVDNASRGFGVTQHGTDISPDSSEAINEVNFRYGELLESFVVESESILRRNKSQKNSRNYLPGPAGDIRNRLSGQQKDSFLAHNVKGMKQKHAYGQKNKPAAKNQKGIKPVVGTMPKDPGREKHVSRGGLKPSSITPKVGVKGSFEEGLGGDSIITENREGIIILLPGGFKPPTGGHYAMIKHYEKQSDVAKIIVVTGRKEREGVTYEQSQAIFNVYGGFSEKVEFLESKDPTPLLTCYELMKNEKFVSQYPNMSFSLGAGDKGKDPARIKEFVNYFNQRPDLTGANLIAYRPAPACEVDSCPASASRMRKAFRDGDWELFKKLLPDDNFYDDVVQILNKQSNSQEVTAEGFFTMTSQSSLVNEIFYLIDEILQEQEEPTFDRETAIKSTAAKLVLDPNLTGHNIPDEKKKIMINQLSDVIMSRLEAQISQYSEDPEKKLQDLTSEESSMGGGNVQGAPGAGETNYDSIIR